MEVEIIYEKKYPRIDLMEQYKEIEHELPGEPGESEETALSFDEMMQQIEANTIYVLMPERLTASEEFIRLAIEISELYELDARIERHFNRISVDYFFNCTGGMRYINKVFGMADEFAFFKNINGWDFTISLDFYTHAAIRNGRVVSP